MSNVLRKVHTFNLSWALHNHTLGCVNSLSIVKPLQEKIGGLEAERMYRRQDDRMSI